MKNQHDRWITTALSPSTEHNVCKRVALTIGGGQKLLPAIGGRGVFFLEKPFASLHEQNLSKLYNGRKKRAEGWEREHAQIFNVPTNCDCVGL